MAYLTTVCILHNKTEAVVCLEGVFQSLQKKNMLKAELCVFSWVKNKLSLWRAGAIMQLKQISTENWRNKTKNIECSDLDLLCSDDNKKGTNSEHFALFVATQTKTQRASLTKDSQKRLTD